MSRRFIFRRILQEEVNKDIITVTPEWMRSTYERFNKEYWGGELPNNISFKLNGRLKRAFARASYKYSKWEDLGNGKYIAHLTEILGIEFSTGRKGETWVFENTMLHEMIHIADYYYHPEHFAILWENGRQRSAFRKGGYDAHGADFFLKEAQRLLQYGWTVNTKVTKEENQALQLSDEYVEKQKKKEVALQKKRNKAQKQRNEAYNRWKQIRYTIDTIANKGDFIYKIIDRYTNGFTEPVGYRVINIGELKLIFSDKRDWCGHVLDLDKNDAQQIKYKAIIYIGDSLMEAIKNRGIGNSTSNIDLSRLFDEDYNEMYDLEDEYGF